MSISAPQKSEISFFDGKMSHLYQITPLCYREDGPTGHLPPSAPLSPGVQTPRIDPAEQAVQSGKKADPPKQRKKMWSRKFISQKQRWSCLTRTEVNRVFPPPCAGNKAAHPPALIPRHLALFRSTASDFH